MHSDKSITVAFLPVCKLTITIKGQGAAEPGPGAYTYDRGTRVTVSALPAPGWRLDRWYGALSGSASTRVITMNSNRSITACFTALYHFKKEVESTPSYIANRNSKEIHKPDCYWVTRMKEINKMPCDDLGEVIELIRDREYNGCFYCLPRYDKDTLDSQIVLDNLEEDLVDKEN